MFGELPDTVDSLNFSMPLVFLEFKNVSIRLAGHQRGSTQHLHVEHLLGECPVPAASVDVGSRHQMLGA